MYSFSVVLTLWQYCKHSHASKACWIELNTLLSTRCLHFVVSDRDSEAERCLFFLKQLYFNISFSSQLKHLKNIFQRKSFILKPEWNINSSSTSKQTTSLKHYRLIKTSRLSISLWKLKQLTAAANTFLSSHFIPSCYIDHHVCFSC